MASLAVERTWGVSAIGLTAGDQPGDAARRRRGQFGYLGSATQHLCLSRGRCLREGVARLATDGRRNRQDVLGPRPPRSWPSDSRSESATAQRKQGTLPPRSPSLHPVRARRGARSGPPFHAEARTNAPSARAEPIPMRRLGIGQCFRCRAGADGGPECARAALVTVRPARLGSVQLTPALCNVW